jgi:hypothetical protein
MKTETRKVTLDDLQRAINKTQERIRGVSASQINPRFRLKAIQRKNGRAISSTVMARKALPTLRRALPLLRKAADLLCIELMGMSKAKRKVQIRPRGTETPSEKMFRERQESGNRKATV